jgi:hypothetical protein
MLHPAYVTGSVDGLLFILFTLLVCPTRLAVEWGLPVQRDNLTLVLPGTLVGSWSAASTGEASNAMNLRTAVRDQPLPISQSHRHDLLSQLNIKPKCCTQPTPHIRRFPQGAHVINTVTPHWHQRSGHGVVPQQQLQQQPTAVTCLPLSS